MEKNKKTKIILLIVSIVALIILAIFVKNSNCFDKKTSDILSKDQAIVLLQQKYDIAGALYCLSQVHFMVDDDEISWEENGDIEYGMEIMNYDEVVKTYFTDNMIADFEENAIFLKLKDSKAYVLIGGWGFSTYERVDEFKDINITENKITSIVKTRHIDDEGNFIGYLESPFNLVKNEDNWLIDEFNHLDVFSADLEKIIKP